MSSSIVEKMAEVTHGMDGTNARPDWPYLRLEEVTHVLRRYPAAGRVTAILSHSPRPFSAASIVDTTTGKLFVKRHSARVRDLKGVTEEHRLMAYLRQHSAPVCEVLSADDGSTAVVAEGWCYEVHSLAPGEDLYSDVLSWKPFFSTAHARSAGRAMASLHIAAAGYDAPPRHAKVLVSSFSILNSPDPMPKFERYIAEHSGVASFLAHRDWHGDAVRVLLPLHKRLLPYLSLFKPLWTHNDLHASNFTWSGTGDNASVAAVIDFGLADRTCALYDLATAIERNAIEWLDIPAGGENLVHWDQLAALLEGYTAVLPLSPAEAEALAALLPLVHAEFALSELEYFQSITKSAKNANITYDAFLIGHAVWFSTPEGHRLTEYLRARAANTMETMDNHVTA